MIDPKEFRAPFITIDEIRKTADEFRSRYWTQNTIPIDILEILEIELDIEIHTIANLREAGDVDALLLGDLKTVIVDKNDYLSNTSQNRLRFSIAHEIGHLVLHANIFSEIGYTSEEEWITFFQTIPDDQYTWIEQHAYEFAGRLLVPRDKLKERLTTSVELAEKAGFSDWDKSGESALEYIASAISKSFGVSGQVIEKRLTKERLWPPKTKSLNGEGK